MATRRVVDEIEAVDAVRAPTLPDRSATLREMSVIQATLAVDTAKLADGETLAQWEARLLGLIAHVGMMAAAG